MHSCSFYCRLRAVFDEKSFGKIRHFGKVITLPFFTKILIENNAFFTGQKLFQKSQKLS